MKPHLFMRDGRWIVRIGRWRWDFATFSSAASGTPILREIVRGWTGGSYA